MRATERERHTHRERERERGRVVVTQLHMRTGASTRHHLCQWNVCLYFAIPKTKSAVNTEGDSLNWSCCSCVCERSSQAAGPSGCSCCCCCRRFFWAGRSIITLTATIHPPHDKSIKKNKKNKPKNKSLRLLFQLRDTLTRVDPEALLLHCGFTCCHQNFSSNWFELFHDSRRVLFFFSSFFFFIFFGQILLCTLGAINWNNVTFLGVFL